MNKAWLDPLLHGALLSSCWGSYLLAFYCVFAAEPMAARHAVILAMCCACLAAVNLVRQMSKDWGLPVDTLYDVHLRMFSYFSRFPLSLCQPGIGAKGHEGSRRMPLTQDTVSAMAGRNARFIKSDNRTFGQGFGLIHREVGYAAALFLFLAGYVLRFGFRPEDFATRRYSGYPLMFVSGIGLALAMMLGWIVIGMALARLYFKMRGKR